MEPSESRNHRDPQRGLRSASIFPPAKALAETCRESCGLTGCAAWNHSIGRICSHVQMENNRLEGSQCDQDWGLCGTGAHHPYG